MPAYAMPVLRILVVLVVVVVVVLLVVVMLGVVLAWLRRRLFVVTIKGTSMLPTYRPGDRVIAWRTRRRAVGQVVVVGHPGQPGTYLIKRVAAVPGDAVPESLRPVLLEGPTVTGTDVPVGSLVLLGDNSEVSFDSRSAGYFAAEAVLGRVLFGTRSARRS